MIKQTHLRVFATVAEFGSISAAAQQLHRSPSAVSMMVTNLERQLNRPLFEAESKAKLTPFGRYVFEISREQIVRFDQAINAIEAYANNDYGRVDIATLPSFASTYLPKILQNFISRYPQIALSIRDDSSAHIKQLLLNGEIDLGIASFSPEAQKQNTEIDSQALCSDQIGIVCQRSHALNQLNRSLRWEDLHNYNFIANGTCSLIQDDQFQQILNHSMLEVQNTTSLLALVATGIGISTLPKLAVEAQHSDVVFIPTAYSELQRTINLLTLKHRTLSPAADAFCALLQTQGDWSSKPESLN